MDQFEFVVSLLSVVVGLGITHILSTMGDAVHRLRGQGAPLRIDAVFLLWVGVLITWFISAWWAEYKLQSMGFAWTFRTYLLLITYFVSLFFSVVILMPSRLEGISDTYTHFIENRWWLFGSLLVATLLDFFDTLIKGADWALRFEYLMSQTGVFLAVCIAGWVTKRRVVQIVLASSRSFRSSFTSGRL
jgi:hypothetical protein